MLGGGRNFSRLFGVDAEYMYYDLPLKSTVSQSQSLNNASAHMQSISLDGIVSAPRHFGKLGAYWNFRRRFLPAQRLPANRAKLTGLPTCQPTWTRWWGINCYNNVLQGEQWLSSYSKDAGGFNFGGGLTYPLNALHKAKLYGEWRYHRAYQSDGKTIVIPITVGLRW